MIFEAGWQLTNTRSNRYNASVFVPDKIAHVEAQKGRIRVWIEEESAGSGIESEN